MIKIVRVEKYEEKSGEMIKLDILSSTLWEKIFLFGNFFIYPFYSLNFIL